MKNFAIALLIGIIIGAGGFWYFGQERGSTPALQQAEKRAGEAYRGALRADPKFADGRYNLALLCDQLGQPREALRHLAQ